MSNSNKKLLIITGKDDIHADYLIEKINNIGYKDSVIRLHPEDSLTNLDINFHNTDLYIKIKDSQKEFYASEIKCVWYRKPNDIIIPNTIINDASEFVHGQIITINQGIHYLIRDDALWINPRITAYRARNKLKQIQTAIKIGFITPDTLITNIPQKAHEFSKRYEYICSKDIDTTTRANYNNKYPFYTLKLTANDIEKHANLITHVPTLFQQFIDKSFDLRIIVLQDHIFGIEIHSQEIEQSKNDFRTIDPRKLKHIQHEIPKDIKIKIKEYMNYYNLIYSAFDFAVTKQGEYYFLENNPNGQWLWLEDLSQVKISNAFLEIFSETLNW